MLIRRGAGVCLVLLLAALAAWPTGAAAAPSPLMQLGAPPRGEVQVGQAGAGTRIVGGNTTENSKYPWQAEVFVETEEGTFLCGGTLIHPFIVMTAAHCLLDEFGEFEPGIEVEVWLGRTSVFAGGEPIHAYNLWAPTSYNPFVNFPQSNRNDVAFISLEEGSLRPRPLLAGPDERALWTPGRAAVITGWGTTAEEGELSPVLKEAQVPIVADETCVRPEIDGSRVDPATMVCAGDLAGGTDTCQGDSGGPLLSPIDGGGYRLTGVTSWGFGCARPNKPGVYTRVAADPLESFVRNTVATIEREDEIPLAYTGVNVVGSGARPPGCGVAEAELAQASAAVTAAAAAVTQRQDEVTRARKAVKQRSKALKAALRAKRRAVGGAASRRAGKRVVNASRQLRNAKRPAKRANQQLAAANTGAAGANATLPAVAAHRTAICG